MQACCIPKETDHGKATVHVGLTGQLGRPWPEGGGAEGGETNQALFLGKEFSLDTLSAK